tara:strand:- start:359 stop:505 length:147 start_codon:yes stop_codon:yes gene_type:complete
MTNNLHRFLNSMINTRDRTLQAIRLKSAVTLEIFEINGFALSGFIKEG